MMMWKRFTQTLGDIWAPCLMGALLGTTGVLFIKLPISPTNDSTLGESIFGKRENQRVESEGSLPKVIGSGIMGHVQNSRTTSNSLEKSASPENPVIAQDTWKGQLRRDPTTFSSRRSDGGT